MPQTTLNDLLSMAGEEPSDPTIEFHGRDPIFPTPFRIGDLGAAVIGASALQASRLWRMKTGRAQKIDIDVDAAAIAMRSSRYVRTDPPPAEGRRTTGGGLGTYTTRDGRWVYFQRLFPHHRARLLEVLKCAEEEDAIAAAVAAWDGLALEEAVVGNGASAAMIRTHDEWAAHDQGQALSRLPLFEILRIGDSAPEPLPPGDRPLTGIRVLDVTRVLAGPTCGRTLAEHGADVLRVGTNQFPDNEAMMRDTGHGKRSTVIDLATSDGTDQMKRLIPGADVFSQGYRPGSLAARGFSPEHVAALRPGIVYVTISAWGHEGPWRERRGFDSVVQAASGIADEIAADGKPRFLPANPLDYSTGYLAAFGVMVALARRARSGGSYHVRVSLAQTGRYLADLSRADHDLWPARPADLPTERIDQLMTTSDTPFGPLRYFKPVAQLSETPARWDRPTAPLDQDAPVWV